MDLLQNVLNTSLVLMIALYLFNGRDSTKRYSSAVKQSLNYGFVSSSVIFVGCALIRIWSS
jgi:hypothetical protein